MHSLSSITKPQPKSDQLKLRTYLSLQTRKRDQAEKSRPQFTIRTNLKKQIDLIQTMNNWVWLKEPKQIQVRQKNMSDLLDLIKRQKSVQPQFERGLTKRMKARINSFCLKKLGNISVIAASIVDQYTSHNNLTSQRSNILEYSDQPTRVKLFKKLSKFNRNETLNELGQQKKYPNILNDGFFRETFWKNRKSPTPIIDHNNQRSTVSKKTNQEFDLQCLKTDKRSHLHKQQSIQCKGDILSKEHQFSRRKKCIRKMSIIEKELESRSQQPVFLLQV